MLTAGLQRIRPHLTLQGEGIGVGARQTSREKGPFHRGRRFPTSAAPSRSLVAAALTTHLEHCVHARRALPCDPAGPRLRERLSPRRLRLLHPLRALPRSAPESHPRRDRRMR